MLECDVKRNSEKVTYFKNFRKKKDVHLKMHILFTFEKKCFGSYLIVDQLDRFVV